MDSTRKYYRTKFKGIFYRISEKFDFEAGKQDRIYCFWYADSKGKGHWKTVGRQSEGVSPLCAHNSRISFLSTLFPQGGVDPEDFTQTTVGQAVDAYTFWAESENKNVARQHSQYARHLKDKLHRMPLSQLSLSMLAAIKAELLKTPVIKRTRDADPQNNRCLAHHTINCMMNFLRAAINRVIGMGLWNGPNPLSSKHGGAWQLLKVNNSRLRFFAPDEAKMLLIELFKYNPQVHDMALLSLRTGLRATEIFKLKGLDVDSYADILYVISKGNSRTAIRIPADIASMLRAYEREPGEPLFIRPETGTAFAVIPPSFRRAVRRLGLAAHDHDSLYTITFHTLRHTFASWLAQSGKVSLFELKNLMRHKSITMTLRYAHLFPDQESEKLTIIDDCLTEPAPDPALSQASPAASKAVPEFSAHVKKWLASSPD